MGGFWGSRRVPGWPCAHRAAVQAMKGRARPEPARPLPGPRGPTQVSFPSVDTSPKLVFVSHGEISECRIWEHDCVMSPWKSTPSR